jgi:hypothetical protein
MASTGSSFEAVMAGIIPEINPMNADKLEPKMTFFALMINSKSSKLVTTIEQIQTNKIPNIPPSVAKIIASKRN